MKKNDKEKTKKIAVVTGLVLTGVLAVAGISLTLKREEPATYLTDESDLTAEVNVDANITESTPTPSTEPTKEPDIVISTDVTPDIEGEGVLQSIQPDSVKTEEEKPSEPPADNQEAGTTDKNTPPDNTQIPAETTTKPDTSDHPQNGTIRDGQIYVEGFGWVDYEGGGTSGTQADDMYENGNKVGSMD